MTYEGVNFNSAWVSGLTFEEFKKHEAHHGLSNDQLKEAYALAKKEQADLKKTAKELEEVAGEPVVGKGKGEADKK